MSSLVGLLRDIAAITTTERGCTRLAFTAAEDEAHDRIWNHLATLRGLTRMTDAADNTFILPDHSRPNDRPIILVGSHLDTVIEGGWLDGALGVAVGAETLRRVATDGTAHPSVGLVIFRDEEGVRFGTGLFGSRVFGGACTEDDLKVTDRNGTTLSQVVRDPAACLDYAPPVRAACFLECHVEQGLRLEDAKVRVGIVSAVVGIRRYVLHCVGSPNHAGTTEMHRRRDALVPAARIVSSLPDIVTGMHDAVVTCGRFDVGPGAPNIVPGHVTAVVEIRAQDHATLDEVETRFSRLVEGERGRAGASGVTLEVQQLLAIAPTPTSSDLRDGLATVLSQQGISSRELASMAGHDTQHAALRCPSAMFFIPSLAGISHSPDEDSRIEDITLALDVMHAWVEWCVSRWRL